MRYLNVPFHPFLGWGGGGKDSSYYVTADKYQATLNKCPRTKKGHVSGESDHQNMSLFLKKPELMFNI